MDGNLAMANSIVNQTEEQANTPNYPKGTTKEQWDRYAIDLKAHEERVAREKPIEPDHLKYKEQKYKGEWTFIPGYLERYSNDWDAYQKKLSEWEMMCSCDAPNKPGYYRANND